MGLYNNFIQRLSWVFLWLAQILVISGGNSGMITDQQRNRLSIEWVDGWRCTEEN